MKNLFKHFNDIDIDVYEFEEADVTEFEKAQFKKDMKNRISKTKSRKWMKGAAAVCLSLGIGAASLAGLSYTTFAQEIPIVNSILKLFSDKEEILAGYEELAERQNLTAENSGVKITVNESLFDSKVFFVGYLIETDKDLGETPQLTTEFKVNGQEHALFDTVNRIEKVGENQYAGLTSAILPLTESLQEADFEFHISKLASRDEKEFIEGNWNFEVYAKATENTVQIVERESEKEDMGIRLDKVTYTPISFMVNFKENVKNKLLQEKWDFVVSGFKVTDDLGNTYRSRMNGGIGELPGDLEYMFTYEKLHPDAKTLTFTPFFDLMEADEVQENGVLFRDYDSNAPKETMMLDDIIIEIPK
ncbi:DUF4179 domain-containing protein [Solibacillus silvestris]|uniref:DUF4179 domain-containing protein n=1 Tax=Solibacillus silvestris TaxID=76853 RepID=UPI003F80D961